MNLSSNKKAFTIIELLTVMSIIVILLSILVPALNRVRRYAKVVMQKGQFHEISKGLELYQNDHDQTYPDSDPFGADGDPYCGAMKLCEAMLGQDGEGYHPDSRFAADGLNATDIEDFYPFNLCQPTLASVYQNDPNLMANLRERISYVYTEDIRACRLGDLFADQGVFLTPVDTYANAVICDVFLNASIRSSCAARSGEKMGMPVLYYKADPSKMSHDIANPDNTDNKYEYLDNYALTALGLPWDPCAVHPLYFDGTSAPGELFYRQTRNKRITSTLKPHNEDTYILISAGWDGLYGTRDDVYNFAD